MIMSGDKKRAVAAIIESRFPKSGDIAKENSSAFHDRAKPKEPEMDEGLLSAAEEMIEAFKGEDAKALASSLKNFISMCDPDEDEESDGETEVV
jgi:hypothetical protein